MAMDWLALLGPNSIDVSGAQLSKTPFGYENCEGVINVQDRYVFDDMDSESVAERDLLFERP